MVVNIFETPAGVEFSYAGFLNTGASAVQPTVLTPCNADGLLAEDFGVCVGVGLGNVPADYYPTTGPTSLGLGPDPITLFGDTATGPHVVLDAFANTFGVPAGYVGGTLISGTATFGGQTLASMGINATLGSPLTTWTLLTTPGGPPVPPLLGGGTTISLNVLQ